VRDVKAIVNPRPAYDDRGRGRGRGRGVQGGGGRGGQGGYGGGGRGGRGGYDRGGGAGRGDVEQHGRDGSFRSSIRIIGLEQLEDALKSQEAEQATEEKPAETPPTAPENAAVETHAGQTAPAEKPGGDAPQTTGGD